MGIKFLPLLLMIGFAGVGCGAGSMQKEIAVVDLPAVIRTIPFNADTDVMVNTNNLFPDRAWHDVSARSTNH